MASTIPAHPDTAAISIQAVSKHYGNLRAVDGVDLQIPKGELFGLIGHNGAGKSTLFKMMLGLIPLSAGSIHIAGASVSGPDFRKTRRSIGYLPENIVLYDNLSGLETLQFFAQLKSVSRSACPPLLEQVGLAHAGSRPVREYSKGMRQRLGFAQALLGQPQVLFLDEPTSGLDPQAIRDFYTTLRGLRDSGVTIIITSHILAELQERVDRLAIMAAGQVQALGSVHALRQAMDLPLHIQVHFSSAEDLQVVFKVLQATTSVELDATQGLLQVHCPRAQKMEVLRTLAVFNNNISDIQMTEASLEDVFFGFSH